MPVRSQNSADSHGDSIKYPLAVRLNEVIHARGLSQVQAALVTGLPQPKISELRRKRVKDISAERLMQALAALGQDVKIIVEPASGSASVSVANEAVPMVS